MRLVLGLMNVFVFTYLTKILVDIYQIHPAYIFTLGWIGGSISFALIVGHLEIRRKHGD